MILSPDDFMQIAIIEAKKALALNEVPVGAIVVKGNKIIGKGYNSVIRDNSVTAHAEINAINEASKMINNYRLVNCDLYVTLEPCHMCAKAIVDARIDSLYFGAYELKTGAIESVDYFLDKNHLNHKVLFSGGHMQKQSSDLLREFFQSKRKKKIS
ncbi:MAG: tRNA adenosine(34) deaminase TadA [SAR86 cluster bacterium]|nr:tRNA adenosine(34) deaminase TadA [SAR86 cluster bacterium]